MWFAVLTVAIAGLALALTLVPLARRLAAYLGFVAHPTPDRWHQRSVSKLGGLAMAASLALIWPATGFWDAGWPLVLTSGLMFAIGLVDDWRPVRPGTKLVGQVLVVALFLYLVPVAITGHVLVDHALAFFWVLGLTNAFNLLDNIDGLAAGIAAIAATFLTIALVLVGSPATIPLALAFAAFVGVMLGFLRHNFQPASIFMGDSGSHLIGFFVSGGVLLAVPDLPTGALVPAVASPIVTLLIPIFDTGFVTITRGLAGRSIFSGGRDHTSHRLIALGITERHAVLVLYVLAVLGGLAGMTVHVDGARYTWGIVALYAALLAILGLYLGNADASHSHEHAAAASPLDFAARYRGLEVALDLLLVAVAYYFAFGLRFAEPEFSHFLPYFAQSVPLVLGVQIGGLAVAGKYRRSWRSFTATDARVVLTGVAYGSVATVLAVLFLYRFEGFSRAVFVYDAAVLAALLVGGRTGLAAVDDALRRQRAAGRGALIIGAGRGGALTARQLVDDPAQGIVPLGFLDDDPALRGQRIEGYRVLGTLDDLPARLDADRRNISAVIVAIAQLPRERFDIICAVCDARRIPVRRMRFALEDTDWRDRSPGVIRFRGR